MSKLKKCRSCNIYTLQEICKKCGNKTSDAHYKFINIKHSIKNFDKISFSKTISETD